MLRLRTWTRNCSTAPLLHGPGGNAVSDWRLRRGGEDEPESIAGSDEDAEAVLYEPEADFRQIRTLPDTIHANEGYTVRLPLLGRRQRAGQLCTY